MLTRREGAPSAHILTVYSLSICRAAQSPHTNAKGRYRSSVSIVRGSEPSRGMEPMQRKSGEKVRPICACQRNILALCVVYINMRVLQHPSRTATFINCTHLLSMYCGIRGWLELNDPFWRSSLKVHRNNFRSRERLALCRAATLVFCGATASHFRSRMRIEMNHAAPPCFVTRTDDSFPAVSSEKAMAIVRRGEAPPPLGRRTIKIIITEKKEANSVGSNWKVPLSQQRTKTIIFI